MELLSNDVIKLCILLSSIGAINWAFTAFGKNWFAILFGSKGNGRLYERMYTKKQLYKCSNIERFIMLVVGLAGWISLYIFFTKIR